MEEKEVSRRSGLEPWSQVSWHLIRTLVWCFKTNSSSNINWLTWRRHSDDDDEQAGLYFKFFVYLRGAENRIYRSVAYFAFIEHSGISEMYSLGYLVVIRWKWSKWNLLYAYCVCYFCILIACDSSVVWYLDINFIAHRASMDSGSSRSSLRPLCMHSRNGPRSHHFPFNM